MKKTVESRCRFPSANNDKTIDCSCEEPPYLVSGPGYFGSGGGEGVADHIVIVPVDGRPVGWGWAKSFLKHIGATMQLCQVQPEQAPNLGRGCHDGLEDARWQGRAHSIAILLDFDIHPAREAHPVSETPPRGGRIALG